MTRLAGKRVIITGGSTGIGAAVACRFLEEGAKVCVWCRNKVNAAKIKADLPRLSDVVTVDVADPAGVDRAFPRSLECLGGLDVLICNAGISIRHDFVDIPREDFDRIMRVNVHGVFYVSQLARHMLKQEEGGAILITASTSRQGYLHYADYNASKAAVPPSCGRWRSNWRPKSASTPSIRATLDAHAGGRIQPRNAAGLERHYPLRRHARPEEIAALYVYLASDEAAYASGAASRWTVLKA
jgi:NAD(P)-dependent dehydrogenase (short-subunit alcohol dehydrogenase family)